MLFGKVLSPIGGKQISHECCGGQLQEQYNNRDESEVTGLVMGLESTQLVEAVFREEEAGVLVLGGQFIYRVQLGAHEVPHEPDHQAAGVG